MPPTPAAEAHDPDRCRAGLREAAARRAAAAGEQRAATVELGVWCARASSAGLSVTEIARLGEISRETTYRLLERERTPNGAVTP
jgi:hypothetical protein